MKDGGKEESVEEEMEESEIGGREGGMGLEEIMEKNNGAGKIKKVRRKGNEKRIEGMEGGNGRRGRRIEGIGGGNERSSGGKEE